MNELYSAEHNLTFKVGQVIRAYDHQPRERTKHLFVEGVVVEINDMLQLVIHVLKDTVFPIGCRLTITTPIETFFDWKGRLTIIDENEKFQELMAAQRG